MKWKDFVISVLIIVILFQGVMWIAVFIRTDVADYDIKLAHYQMETKYCPYCGELLEKE